jgi:MYXO-CTERM domain-containing protein
MFKQLLLTVPTVAISLVLTFAPVFAQDAATAPATSDDVGRTAVATDDDDSPDLGWLGLLGLIGLGGLMRRDRNDHRHGDRPATR